MKRLTTILFALLALEFALSAGNVTREEKFPSIRGISAGDNFNVKIVDGSEVTVKMTIEDILADYVHLNIVGGILTVDYDEKSITREIRAAISRRDPKSIMMDVVISIPPSCPFDSLCLFKNVTLTSTASFGTGKNFSVNARDNAVIKSLTVNAHQTSLTFSRHADAKLSVCSASTSLKCDGNSSCEINLSGTNAAVECTGSATLKIHSSADALVANVSGSSKLTIDGTADSIDIAGKNSSLIDAYGLDVKTATLNVTNATCQMNVQENLSITLAGGAKLHYSGAPVIEIGKIERSSIYKKEPEQSSAAESK